MRRDGQIQFRTCRAGQREREAERNFTLYRGGILYWNGARSVYDRHVPDRDLAMFLPGSNVLFPKPDSARAINRYRTQIRHDPAQS